jgi:hypothetical protein
MVSFQSMFELFVHMTLSWTSSYIHVCFNIAINVILPSVTVETVLCTWNSPDKVLSTFLLTHTHTHTHTYIYTHTHTHTIFWNMKSCMLIETYHRFTGNYHLQILTFCWPCISSINQLDAQNFCFTISLFRASACFDHMCSKHLEARNKLIVKQKVCASSWLITEINTTSKFTFLFFNLRLFLR